MRQRAHARPAIVSQVRAHRGGGVGVAAHRRACPRPACAPRLRLAPVQPRRLLGRAGAVLPRQLQAARHA
eukprot:2968840-Prymnesium_polylepis.1